MADHNNNNNFITRVYSYSLVQYASDTAKGYYSSAKESNSYIKASLESVEQYSQQIIHKAEEYSQQPTIDSIIHKVNDYGCKQLDKIENGSSQLKKTYEDLKPKTIQSLDSAANKIHGTSLEVGLLKTIGLVDNLVESLFPPSDDNERTDDSDTKHNTGADTPNVVAASTPVVNKLLERVNTKSLLLLPSRSYNLSRDLLFQAESIPQINYCVGVLTTSALKIKQVSDASALVARSGFDKGAALTKDSVEYVYTSLNNVAGLVGKVVQLVTRLDAVEAKASVAELIAMIQTSKAQFSQSINSHLEYDYESWKKDISAILQKAGELLATQAALGYDKVQHSNVAAVRASVATIQSLVQGIVERFAPSA